MTPCQKLLKQEGTARWIESMQQSSATPKNRDVGRGLWKIVGCSQSTSQCLLVLARCHPYILLHFYTCFTHFSQQCIGIGNNTVGKQRKSYMQPPEVYTEEDQRASFVHVRSAPAGLARSPPSAPIYLGMRIRMGSSTIANSSNDL